MTGDDTNLKNKSGVQDALLGVSAKEYMHPRATGAMNTENTEADGAVSMDEEIGSSVVSDVNISAEDHLDRSLDNSSSPEVAETLPCSAPQTNLLQKETASSSPNNPVVLPQTALNSKHSLPQSNPSGDRGQYAQHQRAGKTPPISPQKPESQPPPFPLPNGTVGKTYRYNILKAVGPPVELIELDIDGLANTGLHFDTDIMILEGIPEKAGDLSLVLRYRSKKQNDPSRFVMKMLSLTINADPKSLWKDLPSNKSDLYWKPDSDSSALVKGRSLIAASQRGRSHAHEGKFRDDDFGLAYLDDGWYLAAVADGAGSSRSARRGSQIVCSCALDYLKQNIAKEFDATFETRLAEYVMERGKDVVQKAIRDKVYTLLAGAAHLGIKKIQEEAKAHSVPPKDYATTLIAAVMRHYEFGWFVGAYWVGDGCIGIYSRNSEVRLLGEPDGGEFAGQTRFITMPEVWEPSEIYRRVRFEIVDDFTAVILMTDGITDANFESENNLKNIEKWDEFWNDLTKTVPLTRRAGSPEKELLQWLDFWSPGNHDDRTIVILV